MSEKKGNKGEWSESFCVIKAIVFREISDISGSMNIVQLLRRRECEIDKDYFYDGDSIVIKSLDNKHVKIEDLKPQIPILFKEIVDGTGHSFFCPVMESTMDLLDMKSIKSSSYNKDDCLIKFAGHGLRGFNIKSSLGANPNIINASGVTNFIFKIIDCGLTDEELNLLSSVKEIVQSIYRCGGRLEFVECDETYANNLGKDGLMVVTHMLIEYNKRRMCKISKITDTIYNEAGYILNNRVKILGKSKNIWKHNFAEILINGGLITPSREITLDSPDASGGVVYLDKNSDMICCINSSKNDMKKYYYDNCYMDTASARNKFGIIPLDNGYRVIKLNFSVRERVVKRDKFCSYFNNGQ